MSLLRRSAKRVLRSLPSESAALYRFCRAYVDRHNGDNDGNMQTNGELVLLESALPDARVVFDVGANVGDWVTAARQVNPHAIYHCFEPSSASFATLERAVRSPNVILNNLALSEREGESALFVFGSLDGSNSVYRREGLGQPKPKEETIQLVTLDAYCDKKGIGRIDFLKLDVEGHELSALRGARHMIASDRIDLIQFEYGATYLDAGCRLRDVWTFIEQVNPGYRFEKLHHDGPRHVARYETALETFKYSNWVLRRR